MTTTTSEQAAPMASAPMRYLPDGSVDWGRMWDTFCVLAREGGPPHRGTMLKAPDDADPDAPGYQASAHEIIRGIAAVSGLTAFVAEPGWIGVRCASRAMASWLAAAIVAENVQAQAVDADFFVPVGASYTLPGEIKNIITAVAKTTHYWQEHLPMEAKRALAVMRWLETLRLRVRGRRSAH
jgi:sirohydrochlorin cobaltochelatase